MRQFWKRVFGPGGGRKVESFTSEIWFFNVFGLWNVSRENLEVKGVDSLVSTSRNLR